VHDYVVWGPFVEFPYRAGTWHWIKLCKKDAQLKGKAWEDGTAEPADWMVRWEIPDPSVSGYPALVAGAEGAEVETCPVSFDRCGVLIGDAPFRCYTKRSTWRATMVASREALARQQTAQTDEEPDQVGNSLLRSGLWDLLYQDFSDPVLVRQMTLEQEDRIWTRDWPLGKVDELAQRYANAMRCGLSVRAHELAGGWPKVLCSAFQVGARRSKRSCWTTWSTIPGRSSSTRIRSATNTFWFLASRQASRPGAFRARRLGCVRR
jgi:hypothetical protein